jgi:AcrR family transcriptional regulator
MARIRLTVSTVTTTAVELVDDGGLDALSLSAVARQLGVGPSALYTHCDGADGLHGLVAVAAIDNLTAALQRAAIGLAGDAALVAMGDAYRRFAVDHPGQFASTLRPPDPDSDDLQSAIESLLEVFALVFQAMGLDDDASTRSARSARSAIHGFLAVHQPEPPTTGADDFDHLLEILRSGLQRP